MGAQRKIVYNIQCQDCTLKFCKTERTLEQSIHDHISMNVPTEDMLASKDIYL